MHINFVIPGIRAHLSVAYFPVDEHAELVSGDEVLATFDGVGSERDLRAALMRNLGELGSRVEIYLG